MLVDCILDFATAVYCRPPSASGRADLLPCSGATYSMQTCMYLCTSLTLLFPRRPLYCLNEHAFALIKLLHRLPTKIPMYMIYPLSAEYNGHRSAFPCPE